MRPCPRVGPRPIDVELGPKHQGLGLDGLGHGRKVQGLALMNPGVGTDTAVLGSVSIDIGLGVEVSILGVEV